MAKTEDEHYTQCMQRFLDLANSMKDEGIETRLVSAGLMSASAIYGTYSFAGNEGRLAPAGIEKMLEAYRQQLEQVQLAKEETRNKA
jgi:hypothetical protein